MANSAVADEVFRALSDPTRRKVLERLSKGPASVSELAKPFDMKLPSFVQHLAILEQSHIVTSIKQGRVRVFEISPQPLKIVEDWLARTTPIVGSSPRSIRRISFETQARGRKPMITPFKTDPNLDLVLERVVDVPRHLVWDGTAGVHIGVAPWLSPRSIR